jgi:hypothetical protein
MAAIAAQTRPPDTVVVSCDTNDAAIGRSLDQVWPLAVARMRALSRPVPPLIQVFREHQGRARPAQTRNNGVRALDRAVGLPDRDLIVGFDGDMVLEPKALEKHAALAAQGFEFVIPFRLCLDEAATARFGPVHFLEGGDVPRPTEPEMAALAARQARYELQLRRRAGPLGRWLVKPHKPKLISAHYAVTARCLRAVNGFDEEYQDYGYEDDDLGRRLHALPARTCIAVDRILAFHLWHPSRAPSRPTDAPGYARFRRRGLPTFARFGWDNPTPQPMPIARTVPAEPRPTPVASPAASAAAIGPGPAPRTPAAQASAGSPRR